MEASMLMTLEVTTVPPELPLGLAHQLMLKLGTRHLPVVSNHKLAGLVSDRDLLQQTIQTSDGKLSFAKMTVGEVMALSPLSAGLNTSVAELARLMVGKKLDAVPIVSRDNELVGLVTSSDLLRLVCEMPGESQPLLSIQIRRDGPDARA
jgi:acetoin utilization protein AcuB